MSQTADLSPISVPCSSWKNIVRLLELADIFVRGFEHFPTCLNSCYFGADLRPSTY